MIAATEIAGGRLAEAWARLPLYLSSHVQISVVALAAGIGISLPLALLASRRRVLRWPVLTAASVVQTIPSIALLALFYPLLLGVSYVTGEVLGVGGFSALGFLPSVLALTLYSMLPILRNTVTGIAGVDATVTEAARGIGMTPRQVLLRVELPLAAPVIIAGIRTSTVWVVGIATLSTPVGQTSLGNYIFPGLQTENWISVLFGCFAASLLALALDQLIGLLESAVRLRSGRRAMLAAAGLVLTVGGGLGASALEARPDHVVGAKTFTEQYILARLIERRIEAGGGEVAVRQGLGSTLAFHALAAGEIDVYVDYSGTIWANQMGRTEGGDRETVLAEIESWLREEHGIRMVGALGFENAYGLAMTRARAEQLGVETLADLARHGSRLTIGGDYEFFDRPEWRQIRDTYGLRFAGQTQYQSTFMYKAVRDGEVDVISAFTSDGRIAAFDLVVLDDPRGAILPYDAVLLVSPGSAGDRRLLERLRPLVGAVDIETMREASQRVDIENRTVGEAAALLDDQVGSGGR